jgi:uncharacterized membrane protein YvlD (DUF360 family)
MWQLPDLNSLTPGQMTPVINIVLVLWGTTVVLSRFLRVARIIHGIVIAVLLTLVGARFFLLGISEQNYWKVVLCFPLFIEGYNVLESRVVRWIRA